MNLESLVGKRTFSGVDYAEHGVLFCLDGVTYLAEEDEDDGYRSCMKELSVYSGKCRNTFPPQDVFCEYSEDGDIDVLTIRDFKTSKTILRIGTDYTDSYYPYFVSEYKPENMSINASEESKATESFLKKKESERHAKKWSAKDRIAELEELLDDMQRKFGKPKHREFTKKRKPITDITCFAKDIAPFPGNVFSEMDAIKELAAELDYRFSNSYEWCELSFDILHFLLNEIKNLRRVTKLNGGKRMAARQTINDLFDQIDGAVFHAAQMTADIKRYNECIDCMIAGGSPCQWCEDYKECQLQAKKDGKGCELWMLAFPDGPAPDGDPAPDGEKGAE